MKFGLNLINFGPGASPDSLASSAEWAERVGFDLAMISDHVAITPDVARAYPAPFYEPFTALAWLAGRTTRIELGTTVVILPYRHPLLLARMASNLDQLSNGRLILGVGVGWARAEFEALGIAFTRRGRLSDDYLEILKTHWAEPKQHPHPPIWVGGRSPAAIRRTVLFGQAWHPLNVGLEWLSAEGLPLLRGTAEGLERPMPAFAPRIKLVLTEAPLDDAQRGPGQGTLDQIRRDMDQLASLDPTYVVLDTYTGQPEDLPNDEAAQRTLDAVLEHVIDLSGGTLR